MAIRLKKLSKKNRILVKLFLGAWVCSFFSVRLYAQKPEISFYPEKFIKGSCYLVKIKGGSFQKEPLVFFGNMKQRVIKIENNYFAFLSLDIEDKRKEDFIEVKIDGVPYVYPVTFEEAVVRSRELVIPETKTSYVGKSKEREESDKKSWAARSVFVPELFFQEEFIVPIKDFPIEEIFYGDKRVIYRGKAKKMIGVYYHRGIDFGVVQGTPVYAANDGEVILAENLFHRGDSVYIHHGAGIVTEYLHLSKILVKKGDKVKRGQIIGEVGNTGISTGPHLHLSLIVNYVLVNPLFWNDPKIKEFLFEKKKSNE